MANSDMVFGTGSDGKNKQVVLVDSSTVDASGNTLYLLGSGSTPVASEVHVGEVSGSKTSVSIEFTRPANTTAYAANDVVGPAALVVSAASNANPIVVTTGTHGLSDGDVVTIASVGGNTNANGNYYVKVTGYSATTFALYTDAALTTGRAGNSAYTSGGGVNKLLRLANIARIAGGKGYFTKTQIMTNKTDSTVQFKLHIFSAPSTTYDDNAAYAELYADRAARRGKIVMPTAAIEGSGSDSVASLATTNTASANLPLSYGCAAGSRDLYFLMTTLGIFTPSSGQSFYVSATVEND